MQTLDNLKRYFGFDSFRSGQEDLVNSVLNGRDTLGIMPTGAGKSICFQLPALMLEGITLVISPLISLMQDQVNALMQAGISAAYLNSSLSTGQYAKALKFAKNNKYKIIYVAPERLLIDDFLSFSKNANISMVTIDEAHCISMWGQDFRQSYLRIPEFIRKLSRRPVISAFTATATPQVRDDIAEKLNLQNPFVLTTGFNRKNLFFEVQKPRDKLFALRAYLNMHPAKSGIIYCLTRKTVENVCAELIKEEYSVTRYHAGLTVEERNRNQKLFLFDERKIMVATNAFGMGIDKSNVSFVIHYNMPGSIESYYQEAGRAGRDGESAECILLYAPSDVNMNRFLIQKSFEENDHAEASIKKDLELLKHITFYCSTKGCLRGCILNYFGEKAAANCGSCLNCTAHFEATDITSETKKILLCVNGTGERYGIGLIVEILHGNKPARIIANRLDKQPTYGTLSHSPERSIKEIVDYLILQGHLELTAGEYPVLRLRDTASEILAGNLKISMPIQKLSQPKQKGCPDTHAHEDLFKKLKLLRAMLAANQRVPAFVIFSDATLRDMCLKLPVSSEQLLNISGVGTSKLERYGKQFLKIIQDYTDQMILTGGGIKK